MPTSEPAAGGDREAVKVCNACGQEKALTDFFGPYTDKETGVQKWKATCKACLAERQAARLKEPSKFELARDQRLRDYPGSKACKDCGQEKPLADFGRLVPVERAAGRVALVFKPRCLVCQGQIQTARRARKAEGAA